MMRDIGVIFRREMGAYFHSPIAYIFIIVFLMLTSGFYTNGFFLSGIADMRDFFGTLPLFLLFFIPALTMRLWAEDQRQGTFELLMTLPMKPVSIVLGKYLASLAFYGIALACTFTLPLSLFWHGRGGNLCAVASRRWRRVGIGMGVGRCYPVAAAREVKAGFGLVGDQVPSWLRQRRRSPGLWLARAAEALSGRS